MSAKLPVQAAIVLLGASALAGCLVATPANGGASSVQLPAPRSGERAAYESTGTLNPGTGDPNRTWYRVNGTEVITGRWAASTEVLTIDSQPLFAERDRNAIRYDPDARRIERVDSFAEGEEGPLGMALYTSPGGALGRPLDAMPWGVPILPLRLADRTVETGEWHREELWSTNLSYRVEPDTGSLEVEMWDNLTILDRDGDQVSSRTVRNHLTYSLERSSIFPTTLEWEAKDGESPWVTISIDRTDHRSGGQAIDMPAGPPAPGPSRHPEASRSNWSRTVPGTWEEQSFAPGQAIEAVQDDPRYERWIGNASEPVGLVGAEYTRAGLFYLRNRENWTLRWADADGRFAEAVVSRDVYVPGALGGVATEPTVASFETGTGDPPPISVFDWRKLDYSGLGQIVDAFENTTAVETINLTLGTASDAYPWARPGAPHDRAFRWYVGGLEPCFDVAYRAEVSALTGQLLWWHRYDLPIEIGITPNVGDTRECVESETPLR